VKKATSLFLILRKPRLSQCVSNTPTVGLSRLLPSLWWARHIPESLNRNHDTSDCVRLRVGVSSQCYCDSHGAVATSPGIFFCSTWAKLFHARVKEGAMAEAEGEWADPDPCVIEKEWGRCRQVSLSRSLSLSQYIYTHTHIIERVSLSLPPPFLSLYMYVYMYIYICTYTLREGERKRERKRNLYT